MFIEIVTYLYFFYYVEVVVKCDAISPDSFRINEKILKLTDSRKRFNPRICGLLSIVRPSRSTEEFGPVISRARN